MACALERYAMKNDMMLGDTPKARKRRRRLHDVRSSGRLWKHSRLIDLYGLATEDQIERYFVFTMVRNPWDRIVSLYRWARVQTFEHPMVTLARHRSFSEYVNIPVIQKTLQTTPYDHYVRTRLGIERCDLFVRLENLDEDLPRLEARLGIRLSPLPHLNASGRERDYRMSYSDRDRRLIGRICARDIARFDYRY